MAEGGEPGPAYTKQELAYLRRTVTELRRLLTGTLEPHARRWPGPDVEIRLAQASELLELLQEQLPADDPRRAPYVRRHFPDRP